MPTSTACGHKSINTPTSARPSACSWRKTSTWQAGSTVSASGTRESWAANAAARTELDHALARQFLDFPVGVAELTEQRPCVLPERGDRIHLRLHARHVEGRLDHVDLAGRRGDL